MFSTHQEELHYLQKLGFAINPLNQQADTTEQIWRIKDRLEKDKDTLNYFIDGLVVKLNDNQLHESLGVVGKTPRGWCAVKFQTEETTTKIVDVTWQVGRTGRVTPVASLEPVELLGTTVKRATLHNYKEFLERNLHLNDTLVIRKAGEIIPEVLQVLYNLRTSDQEFQAPESCPACNSHLALSETEVDLLCQNFDSCPAQVLGRLSYFCKRNIGNITGLSDKQIQKFMEHFHISDIYDIYDLPFEQIREMEGFGAKSVQNLQDSIHKAREIPDYRFLAGLGIDGIGPEVAKLICQLVQKEDTSIDNN